MTYGVHRAKQTGHCLGDRWQPENPCGKGVEKPREGEQLGVFALTRIALDELAMHHLVP
jgi:hypothetical protein